MIRDACHRNFDPPQRGWLPRYGIPRDIIWMGTWWTLYPRRILHAPGAISVHGGVSPDTPQTRALQSEDKYSADWATAAPEIRAFDFILPEQLSDNNTCIRFIGVVYSSMENRP